MFSKSFFATTYLTISLIAGCSGATHEDESPPCQGAGCANACALGLERCGDHCVDLERDAENCGACGSDCGPDGLCSAGECRSECSGALADRCGASCVDLRSDALNCGACGRACDAGDFCSAGQCGSSCGAAAPHLCGASCVDLTSDPRNCGGCGQSCQAGEVCVDGSCASECSGRLPLGCDGRCVDPKSDPRFCGDCATRCELSEVCSDGACRTACAAPASTYCAGLCVDVDRDPRACGACGTACKADAVCSQGSCAADCLGSGETRCGSACVDLTTDPLHCGACDSPCEAGELCSEGTCAGSCGGETPWLCGTRCVAEEDRAACGYDCFGSTPDVCGDACVDLQSDVKHCGNCETSCLVGESCEAGECKAPCTASELLCGGDCIDPKTDSTNCGSCGMACEPTAFCEQGGCRERVVDIVGGDSHVCALLENGDVSCFGYNTQGNVGIPPGQNVYNDFTRGKVSGLDGTVTALSAGLGHTCALASGSVRCWGSNMYGALGLPFESASAWMPNEVTGLSSEPVSLASGYYFNCVINALGGVECWGNNDDRHLGVDGLPRPAPAPVPGLDSGFDEICASSHACARRAASPREVVCWGGNGSGESSGVDDDGYNALPGTIALAALDPNPGLGPTLACGEVHTCALVNGGEVWCWGNNQFGQVGVETSTSEAPVRVPGITASAVFAGAYASCARLTSGELACWGDVNASMAMPGVTPTMRISVPVTKMSMRLYSAFAVTEAGSVLSWGQSPNMLGRDPIPLFEPTPCCSWL